MNSEVCVGCSHVLECVQVASGREPCFCTGDVEATDTAVTEPYGEFRDFTRTRGVTHGGEQADDANLLAVDPRCGFAGAKSFENVFDYLVQAQASVEVLLGGEPNLCVDHSVLGEVLGAFTGDPC